jgi:Fur family transcriptional regulator, ferric uptake regulator
MMAKRAHDHPEAVSTEDWQAGLRARGYRLTPQRELVLRAVDRLGHATPDEILTAVREESGAVNISTVYRTLELLEELGLVRHVHITDRAPTYHSAAAPEHVHLVCRVCKGITEIRPDAVSGMVDALSDQYGFSTDIGHLTVFGTCRSCS